VTEKGAWWAEYGDRHDIWGPAVQIEGQTRCPVCRSGTFNVKRSTLNFQRGDRKGARWAGYGDRHGIWTTGLLTKWTCPSAGRVAETGCRAEIWGQARCPICRSGTFNVKRSTLNFQLGDRKGRMVGRIWGQTRNLCDRTLGPVDLDSTGGAVQAGCGAQIWGQTRYLGASGANRGTDTMSGMPMRNVERPTLNSQLSTG